MSKLTKADLIRAAAANSSRSQTVIAEAMDAINAQIAGLPVGHSITLPGFGRFEKRATQPRTGRNPRTGEPMEIPAGQRLLFKASKAA